MACMDKPFGFSNAKNGYFEIIPCPYDKTTSYGHGTDKGPDAIIEASQELEFYDDEFEFDPAVSHGIKTLEPIDIELQDASSLKPFQALHDICTDAYRRNKFPIVLGGEHSLSLGPVKAAYDYLQSQGKGLTLLHFDAHADLRQEFRGNPYSHACAIYMIHKACPKIKIVSVGIRNISEGECDWLRGLEKQVDEHFLDEMPITIFYARDEFYKTYAYRSALKEFREEVNPKDSGEIKPSPGASMRFWGSKDVIETMRKYGNDNIYITFDVDGFDSSLMPSTGTPEPGGLDWYTPINLIREACKNFNLVGADVVELAPIEALHGADFLAAKLVYKIIACKTKTLKDSAQN